MLLRDNSIMYPYAAIHSSYKVCMIVFDRQIVNGKTMLFIALPANTINRKRTTVACYNEVTRIEHSRRNPTLVLNKNRVLRRTNHFVSNFA